MTSASQRVIPGTRPTIALLIPRIHHVMQTVWLAALDMAKEQDVNLICFPGGEYAESQANALYELISQERVDALIVAPDNLRIPQERIIPFLEQFKPLPVISQGTAVPGFPSVLPDNYHGMRKVVTHLIEDHGYKRIAFARGPEGVAWEQERYRAYADTLQEHGLPLDAHLITPPTSVNWPMSGRTQHVLFDERKLKPGDDLEALVLCADDAEGNILKSLQQRGIRIPDDLAVTGFNDDPCTRAYTPPMTTVRQPLYEVGRQSVLLALASLRGETVPDVLTLPARLIVRRSCGCPSSQVLHAGLGSIPSPSTVLPQLSFGEIVAAQRESIIEEIGELVSPKIATLTSVEQLVSALIATVSPTDANATSNSDVDPRIETEVEVQHPGGVFLSTLEKYLNQTAREGYDVEVWHDVFSVMRRRLIPALDRHTAMRVNDLLHQARVVISEVAQQVRVIQALQADQRADALRDIAAALLGTFDLETLMRVLAEAMPRFGIPSAYLSLYEEPNAPTGWSRLILAYTESGEVQVKTNGLRFPSRQLIPDAMWHQDRRIDLVIEPLYFREESLGFALFEVGPRLGNVYDILRAQISSVLKAESLYEEALNARAAAEKADRLKTRLLANVSHELRTPLNVILGHTQTALNSPMTDDGDSPPSLLESLQHIQTNAEHQLRMVNDLLDLSRAEIDELDLSSALIDPRPFLEEVFGDVANAAGALPEVTWRLELPARLPAIHADPNRLRQILFNLLNNAACFTENGWIELGAEVAPPHLHIWVQDTGTGIPVDQQERIFEPFFTVERRNRRPEGIGLGLSITRRLVALHQGVITLESQLGQGSTFHIYLPLPALSDRGAATPIAASKAVLLLVSSHTQVADEILELSRRQGLEICRLQPGDDLETLLTEVRPAVLAWDRSSALVRDGILLRKLCEHPHLCQIPFIFYDQTQASASLHRNEIPSTSSASPLGMTNILAKPVAGKTLSEVISALCLAAPDTSILIVDDDPYARQIYRDVVHTALPGYAIRTAPNGKQAIALMNEKPVAENTPGLVLLDLSMPETDGFEVLDWMRARPQTRRTPVLILSGRMLSFDDIKRLEGHAQVTLHSKDILSEEETITVLQRILADTDTLPVATSGLVKRVVAYFHQNYDHVFSRQDIAQTIGVNEDYLSEIFRKELGLSPWDYLNRYRVVRAKAHLCRTDDSIATVAFAVGFNDPAYFSRVFRKETGMSPSAYRQHSCYGEALPGS